MVSKQVFFFRFGEKYLEKLVVLENEKSEDDENDPDTNLEQNPEKQVFFYLLFQHMRLTMIF